MVSDSIRLRRAAHSPASGCTTPGELGPPQADQRSRDQLGDPAALGRGRAVGLGPHPGVEALDQPHLLGRPAAARAGRRRNADPSWSGLRRRRRAGRPWSPAATSTAPRPCRGSCRRTAVPRLSGTPSRPRPAATCAVASVESESITTSSSTSGTRIDQRARDRADDAGDSSLLVPGRDDDADRGAEPLLGRRAAGRAASPASARCGAEPRLGAIIHDLASLVERAAGCCAASGDRFLASRPRVTSAAGR